MFTFEVLTERQEFWQHLRCFPTSLLPKHTRSEGLPKKFSTLTEATVQESQVLPLSYAASGNWASGARAGPVFNSVEFFRLCLSL